MCAVVVSSMRNEGAFLLEWVIWQRMLGFTDVVVVTNDCTDRSPQLLGALAQAGWVHHLDVPIPAGKGGITQAKLKAAADLRCLRRAKSVMVCDVDEFLVIHRGQGLIDDLLEAPGRPWLGMSVNWRVFGSAGIEAYEDRPLHQQFTTAIKPGLFLNAWVKSIHRHPRWFARMGEHGPVGLNLEKAMQETGKAWGQGPLVWVNPAGQPIDQWQPGGPYLRYLKAGQIDHSIAQINHYMLRSAESFSLKVGTPSPVAGRDRYNLRYWNNADRRDEENHSAAAYAPRFAALQAQAMALPGVARFHHLSCADHVAAILALQDKAPGQDPRYQHHMDMAARA